ncbi:unnamed protein product [Cladocopium goreaui]|uniref:Myosin light chain kinase A (MLCK-A) n=1 Tax=Cladocopium goreaui TaxID=2562237 RepID=A0A9P1DLS4_9DINO|nr:unnamed protein product [Cladocopium goreaui]
MSLSKLVSSAIIITVPAKAESFEPDDEAKEPTSATSAASDVDRWRAQGDLPVPLAKACDYLFQTRTVVQWLILGDECVEDALAVAPRTAVVALGGFARNVEELDLFMSRLARQHFETVTIEEEIELTSSSILLSQNSQLVLRIPLLLADIAHECVSQAPGGLSSYILGVLPRSRQPGSGTSHSLWVFLVGPCSMKEFNAHLWNFGRHGAVRRDVNSALALTSTVLGAGGCGKVFLANKWDATGDYIDSNLAVKELLPKGKPVECTLRTEIEFLAAAQGHPNVAILHGVFHQIDSGDSENVFKAPGSPEEVMTQDKEVGRDRWFIALQLYTSGDLFERVQRSGPLKEAESVEVMLGLLSALAYVHHLGIVHRDVKCENILLDGNRAILSDFGISCFLSDPESMEKRVGSPGYASPEMLKGESYNEKVDIFPRALRCDPAAKS